MPNQITVTLVGSRYVLETPNGKIHILTRKALKWNLKNVFGLDGADVLSIVVSLDTNQSIKADVAA